MTLRDLPQKKLEKAMADGDRCLLNWKRSKGRMQILEHEKALFEYAYGKGFNAGLLMATKEIERLTRSGNRNK